MDTTVILAQPRVPRLRAAVVYVDSWAWLGMVGRVPRSMVLLLCCMARGPPLGVQNRNKSDAEQVRKSDLNKTGILRVLLFLHCECWIFNEKLPKNLGFISTNLFLKDPPKSSQIRDPASGYKTLLLKRPIKGPHPDTRVELTWGVPAQFVAYKRTTHLYPSRIDKWGPDPILAGGSCWSLWRIMLVMLGTLNLTDLRNPG